MCDMASHNLRRVIIGIAPDGSAFRYGGTALARVGQPYAWRSWWRRYFNVFILHAPQNVINAHENTIQNPVDKPSATFPYALHFNVN